MSDAFEPKLEKRKSRLVFWLVDSLLAILFIGICWATYALRGPSASDYDQGYRIGQFLEPALWLGITSYLLYRFVFKKRKGFGILVFLSLMLVTGFYQLSQAVDKRQSQTALNSALASALEDIAQGRAIDTTRYATDELGRLRPALTLMLTFMQKQKDLYQSFMLGLGECYREVLTPGRLTRRAEILNSKAKRIKADSLILSFESEFGFEIDDVCQKVDSIGPEMGVSKAYAQGFRNGIEKSRTSIAELISIERQFAANLDSLFEFLLVRDGSYYFDSTQIVLATQADADQYNLLMGRLGELVTAEDTWRKGRVEAAKQKLSDLENR